MYRIIFHCLHAAVKKNVRKTVLPYQIAGIQMATQCVPNYHCGTHLPIWMSGNHPTPADGIVTRSICAPDITEADCCDYKDSIRVHCNFLYVGHVLPVQFSGHVSSLIIDFFFYFFLSCVRFETYEIIEKLFRFVKLRYVCPLN